MADVAARAGVSHQTVSRVLNQSPLVRDDTRARVLEAIREMGYRRNSAARQLATNRSGRIGVVATQLRLYGPTMVASSVQQAGHDAGYEVALVALADYDDGALPAAVDRLLDQAVEALVVAVTHRDAAAQVQALSPPVPVVVVQGLAGGEQHAAGIDQVAGAVTATEHLLDLGHRHVAHLTGPRDWVEADQRRDGWRRAHEARGLLPGPELSGDWSPASGHAAGLKIADDPDVTAVFVANDAMALGVMQALHERGRRVPDDVSVVGFDDVPEAAFYWPALTTVTQDFAALGRQALAVTLRVLGGDEDGTAAPLLPELAVRASTAAPRSGA